MNLWLKKRVSRWPGTAPASQFMRQAKQNNLARYTKAEQWMGALLESSDLKWSRQALWGFRIYDFWNEVFGIALEVDGKEHKANVDAAQDSSDWYRSGIMVIRVKNFDEDGAKKAFAEIAAIKDSGVTWHERRIELGISPKKYSRAKLSREQFFSGKRIEHATQTELF